jgi:hypothetical protein
MAFFDGIQDLAFDIVTSSFGDSASWIPSTGGAEYTALVLYKDPTEKHPMSDVDFNIERYIMEYKRGDFPGLKDSVDAGGIETVRIIKRDVTLQFIVRRMSSKYDGQTMLAYLNPPDIV